MKKLIVLLLICGYAHAYGQQLIKLSGVVSNLELQPLSGAGLKIENGSFNFTTNNKGEFDIEVPPHSYLIISYVGYESKRIFLDTLSGNFLKISLQGNAQKLEEVRVSNGYQELPRERATGSFSQIDNALLNRRVSTDVLSRIEDVTPGLIFNRNRGASQNSISIRGRSTILSNDQPLIVVDNFPYDGSIDDINPNEETRDQQKLHGFLQCAIYVMVALEVAIFNYLNAPFWGMFHILLIKISLLPIYSSALASKLWTLLLICLVSVGTLSKKEKDLDPKNHIVYPLCLGLIMFFGSFWFFHKPAAFAFPYTNWNDLAYTILSFLGAFVTCIAMDNISKIIKSGLGKDVWNVEGESFMQPTALIATPYSVNIPMKFYYRKKVHDGWININNPFRGSILIGTPGSGKSFGIVNPFIRQLIAKEFCVCVYDYKYPDLGKIAYYHYLLAKQQGKCARHQFHVINLTEVEKSRRINVWRSDYISTLAEASESAEGLVEALKKGDSSGGSDQFFTQSAINFLAACVYFLSKFQGGKHSSFPHVLSLLNRSYEEIFNTLFSEPELTPLMSPFKSAFVAKEFGQLEGQVGTLKIFISRLATKECFWVFSGDDFNLKISDKNSPGMVVLANDPNTQNINSACYSVVFNRLTKLINTKGNLPSALIIDEVPTMYAHKIENLIAVARSNKVAVLLGLQELPQFQQQYGKDTSATITAVIGNVLSGSVRNKDTLEWLERMFGKNMQMGESLSIDRNKTSMSLNEKLEALIPAGKIASLRTGEMVGLIAADVDEEFTGAYKTSAINCKVNLDLDEIKYEEDNYKDLPVFYDFGDKKEEILRENFLRINSEIEELVKKFTPEPPPEAPEHKAEEPPKPTKATPPKAQR